MVRLGLVLLLAAGCRSGLLEPPDLIGATDGGGLPDAARADLARPPDLASTTCSPHRREFVRLDAIERLDPAVRHMAALRIAASYTFSPRCDVPAEIDFTVMPGGATDGVRLIARLWRRVERGPECAETRRFTRIVTLTSVDGISSPRVVFSDGAPGGTVRLELVLGPPAGASCNPRGLGQSCVNDCECRMVFADGRCIPTGTMTGICAVSCSEDADCPRTNQLGFDLPRCGTPAFARQVCGGGPCDGACPIGQECSPLTMAGSGCRPRVVPFGEGCRCSSDCGRDKLCDADLGACVVPCVTGRDCATSSCVMGRCR
jgi:hypothetical protein